MPRPFFSQTTSWWLDLFCLTIILSLLYFILLGARPLFVPDEGRYAEIAREMIASKDFITPHLNGIEYFEKPVLFYWLGALAIKFGGLNLWSIRSVNAILALIGCLFTYATVRKLYDRATGLVSALILATSMLYFAMGHMISLDLPVTVTLSISLYAFLLATQTTNPTSRRHYMWLAAGMAALAVLTKGLIGLVFPGLIIGAWLSLLNRWHVLKQLSILSSLCIFLLVATPWHLLVGFAHPEFFYFYFIEQHFLRYTTLDVGHYQPVWFFIPTLAVGFFPWICFLPQTLWRQLRTLTQSPQLANNLFFLLWFSIIFLFFSFSKSKLIPYILPAFAPLAILVADYLVTSIRTKKLLGLYVGTCIALLITGALMFGFYHSSQYIRMPDPHTAIFYLMCAASALLIGIFCSLLLLSIYPRIALTCKIVGAGLFALFIFAAFPSLDARSIRPLAERLKPLLTPQSIVVAYNQYYQDLPFYLNQRISILNWRNELSYGMQFQNTESWMLNDESFWQQWHHKQVYVVMDKGVYASLIRAKPYEKIYLLGETLNNVLITNTKPQTSLDKLSH